MQIFDPLELSDGADPEEIKRWREAEIKHGRVAMLAAVGVLVAEVRLFIFCVRRFGLHNVTQNTENLRSLFNRPAGEMISVPISDYVESKYESARGLY